MEFELMNASDHLAFIVVTMALPVLIPMFAICIVGCLQAWFD